MARLHQRHRQGFARARKGGRRLRSRQRQGQDGARDAARVLEDAGQIYAEGQPRQDPQNVEEGHGQAIH